MAEKLKIRISTRRPSNVSAFESKYDLFVIYPTLDEHVFVPAFDRRVVTDFAKKVCNYYDSSNFKNLVLYDAKNQRFQKTFDHNTIISGLSEASYAEIQMFVLETMAALSRIDSRALIEINANGQIASFDVSQGQIVKVFLTALKHK